MCPLFGKQWCVPRQSWAIHHKNNCLTCEFLKLYVGNGHFYVGIAILQLPDEEQILFTEREICLGAPTRHKPMPTSIHEYLACKFPAPEILELIAWSATWTYWCSLPQLNPTCTQLHIGEMLHMLQPLSIAGTSFAEMPNCFQLPSYKSSLDNKTKSPSCCMTPESICEKIYIC